MIINKLKIFLFFLILIASIYPQSDWVRWEKFEPSYEIKTDEEKRDYDLSIESVTDVVVKPITDTYWFFISDVDGDNCPFYPSCSRFFVESVRETNLIQGTLMFFDRFTRDTNFIGRDKHYPRYGTNHYYDPVSLYLLKERKIIYVPQNTFVNE